MRLDKAIVARHLTQSRSRAEMLIRQGSVTVNGKQVTKPSAETSENDEIVVVDSIGYVGRGGLKLEFALKNFGVDVNGLDALDIGASTGGFTECLLLQGAKSVVAVDVGHGQMNEKIAKDERVVLMEDTNARNLTPEAVFGKKDIIVMDVSFISQKAIYPALFSCIKDSGKVITLVKPQFEAGSEFLSKKGIIKDKKVYKKVLVDIGSEVRNYGFYIKNLCVSPIKGGDGNIEFLINAKKGECDNFDFETFLQKEGLI